MRHLRVVDPNERFAAVPAPIAKTDPNKAPADDDFAPEPYRYRLTPQGEAYLAARDRAAAFGPEVTMTDKTGAPADVDAAAKIDALVPHSALDASDAIPATLMPPPSREARLRALFALFFHEMALEPPADLIAGLAGVMLRLGYDISDMRREAR